MIQLFLAAQTSHCKHQIAGVWRWRFCCTKHVTSHASETKQRRADFL